MATGLVALLDDVAAIAKLAASSLDDIAGAAGKAGTKAAGVVVDDTAVTPRYIVGFSPDRELPIIARIAAGSLKNKLLFLLPAALALSAFAPWAVTPLLMLGGAYLCFEAAEKLLEAVSGNSHSEDMPSILDPKQLEKEKVSGAIRTDFILSAEITAIALGTVVDKPFLIQALALVTVGIAITVGVYGVVALIVKMDDIGLHLAQRRSALLRLIGRGLVRAMPLLMKVLSTVGTAAMAWVGGGIIVHGLEQFGLVALPHAIHHAAEVAGQAVPVARAVVEWLVTAAASGILGLVIGAAIAFGVHKLKH